jgi:hypothetical protein
MGGVGKSAQPDRPIPEDHELLVATRRELEAAGTLWHYTGQLALLLAREVVRVDLYGSGAELARVSKAFDETWAAAVNAAAFMASVPDVIDEVGTRRQQKRRGPSHPGDDDLTRR